MAKGRKLTTSRSERYLGSYSSYNNQLGNGTVNAEPELAEDDVWSMADDTVNADIQPSSGAWISRASVESSGSFGRRRSRRRSNTAEHRSAGGLSSAFDDPSSNSSSRRIVHQFRAQDGMAESSRGRHVAASAPVSVPDWSKIYRVDSVESLPDSDDGFHDDSDVVPPHEYLAREYARSRKFVENSVFEGVGRTLKGRDMSRVRDAVWSQTGFDG